MTDLNRVENFSPFKKWCHIPVDNEANWDILNSIFLENHFGFVVLMPAHAQTSLVSNPGSLCFLSFLCSIRYLSNTFIFFLI